VKELNALNIAYFLVTTDASHSRQSRKNVSLPSDDTLICSAVFARLTRVPNMQPQRPRYEWHLCKYATFHAPWHENA